MSGHFRYNEGEVRERIGVPPARTFTFLGKANIMDSIPPSHASWTAEEEDTLRQLYLSHSHAQIAKILGRTETAVRNRCHVLKLIKGAPEWTEEEIALMRLCYADNETPNGFFLDDLSRILGKDKTNICRKARLLGLTRRSRLYGRKSRRKFATEEELHVFRSDRMKQYLIQSGHPLGMAGKKHTDETKAVIAQKSKEVNASLSPEQKKAIALKGVQTKIVRYGTGHPGAFTGNPYSRAKGGKREDLGNTYFRSRWEANYARYLRFLVAQGQIKAWEYEPQTFVFHGVTRGALTYTPDFRVTESSGKVVWHEVKGWMDSKSKTKLKRMTKFYPSETVLVIGKEEYKAIAQFARMIEGWEE